MTAVRLRPLLLGTAAVLATAHVLGVLFDNPPLRHAEILALLALGGYALLGELPKPRWVVPATLLVLVVEAYRSVPAAISPDSDLQLLLPAPVGPSPSPVMLTDGLALTWAPLAVCLLLLGTGLRWPIARKPAARRGPVVAGTVLATLLFMAYPAVRLGEIALDLSARAQSNSTSTDRIRTTMVSTGSVLLAPLVLGLAAICLTAVLFRRGRAIAALGAALLAVAALPQVDLALATVDLLLAVRLSPAVVSSFAVTPPSPIAPPALIAAPLPALAATIELTAYALLAVGLTRAGRREQTITNSPH
ncbi:hypothetical protein [Salinispora oceanensis]|uniref:hypothetical protein n=1 Tax=Salinispora oceanensis TaxID=1050199 RepID=UPI0004854BAC|nr:hypothetical protein [Salinispora oceanensis]